MTQNGYFNTDVARKEWGFNGVMMSDWVATYDGVAAANGGLDLEMPNGAFMNQKNLLPAVKDGRVKTAPSTKRSLTSSKPPTASAGSIARRPISRSRNTASPTSSWRSTRRARAWCC